MPRRLYTVVKEAPFYVEIDEMVDNFFYPKEGYTIEWRPNRVFYDRLRIDGRRPSGKRRLSRSVYATSLTTGTTYRILGRQVTRLLGMATIIKGVVEGYWCFTRQGGDHYGLRYLEERQAPKRLIEKVKKTKETEQIWSDTSRAIRIES